MASTATAAAYGCSRWLTVVVPPSPLAAAPLSLPLLATSPPLSLAAHFLSLISLYFLGFFSSISFSFFFFLSFSLSSLLQSVQMTLHLPFPFFWTPPCYTSSQKYSFQSINAYECMSRQKCHFRGLYVIFAFN